MTAFRDPLAALPTGPCLVGFGAAWCAPWQLLAEPLAALQTDGLQVRLVDVDTFGDLAEQYRVICLPTFCVLRDGREVRRVVGAVSAQELRALAAGSGRGAGRKTSRARG